MLDGLLDVQLITQAKGRVERANQTLQDRLVKELRLAGISNIEQGNEFLLKFWDDHNIRFTIEPADPSDAHRPLLAQHNLERILSKKEFRKVSKNLEVQYNNVVYQITLNKPGRGLKGAKVAVLEGLGGGISIEHRGKLLPFREYAQQEFVGEIVNSKEIDRFLKRKKRGRKPSNKHPWKNCLKNKLNY